jgi:pilus assembly protein FimV
MPLNTRPRLNGFRLKALGAAVASAMLFSNASAVGLGELTVLSALGQPLHAEVELISASKEEDGPLSVKLASYDAFRQANLEFNTALRSLRFALELRGNRQFVRITSTQPMNEPFIDMLLELSGGSGRVVREYVFLLDPANLQPIQTAAPAPGNHLTPKANSSQDATYAKPAASATNQAAPQVAQASAASASRLQAALPAKTNTSPSQSQVKNKPAATTSTGPKSKLTLFSVDAAAAPAASKAASTAMDESVADANARVKALEQKVNDLQKLLEVTNSLLAEMQKQNALAKADMHTAVPAAASAAASPASPEIKAAEVKSDVVAAVPVTPVAPAPAPVPVAPTPPRPAAPKPAATPHEAGWRSDMFLFPGAGLLVALLGAFGIYAVRRKKKQKPFEASTFTASSQPTALVPRSTVGNSLFNASLSLPIAQTSTDETDAVAEADVYIAYGRDGQAEDVLKEALHTQPERHALRLKLLTIYATRKDLHSFESLAREVYRMTKGEGGDWRQAATLGIEIDPSNPLYASGKPAAAIEPLPELTELAEELEPHAPPATPTLEPVSESIGSLTLSAVDGNHSASAADVPSMDLMPVEEIQPASVEPISNDLDFDLEATSLSETPVPTIPLAALDEPKAVSGPIDFDFALPEIPVIGKSEAVSESPHTAPGAPPEAVGPIDFDFDFLIPETPAVDKAEAAHTAIPTLETAAHLPANPGR